MADFKPFSKLVHDRFLKLSKNELFVTVEDNNEIWEHYLASFPEGENPIYKERTEHDCTCCKQFIRNLGGVVAVVDGKLQSIWDVKGAEYPYDAVAAELNKFILSQPISGLFRSSELKYGAETTNQMEVGGAVKRWNHFCGEVANRHFTKMVDKDRGDGKTTVLVFKRGLETLDAESLQTVTDLISSKALYRGEEHLLSLTTFSEAKKLYDKLTTDEARDQFAWVNASSPASRFRNTVIGTLVQELSEGKDLESAVKAFESKVAPTNYKRPTALITPRMIQDAMKTIKELDLESALERRFAKISDVSVNNVLWVDNSVKGLMKGGLESLLMESAVSKAPKDVKAEDISIEDFMVSVLPTVSAIDILVDNGKANNFMSLTAPIHEDSGKLFKWGNDFGWSYDGNVADSIKERVKSAGGNVTNAKLRISLAWFNYDDLDIHIYEPNGEHIYYCNKCGKLDVDMNAGGGRTRVPVENVSWVSVRDGEYLVKVNQFSKRETSDVGFVIEIESEGKISQLSYAKPATGLVDVATVTIKNGKVTAIKTEAGVVGGGISQEKWGIKTETFVKATTLMHSPNYWDENKVGNKHWFFTLDGCKNPDATRGIYNEYLNSSLEKHRKVFEVLGDKTKCSTTDDQLSGMGFSSTRGDTVTVRVKGNKLQKSFNIKF